LGSPIHCGNYEIVIVCGFYMVLEGFKIGKWLLHNFQKLSLFDNFDVRGDKDKILLYYCNLNECEWKWSVLKMFISFKNKIEFCTVRLRETVILRCC